MIKKLWSFLCDLAWLALPLLLAGGVAFLAVEFILFYVFDINLFGEAR